MARPFSQDWERKAYGNNGFNVKGRSSFNPNPGFTTTPTTSANNNQTSPNGTNGANGEAGIARPHSEGTKYMSKEAEVIDTFFEDLENYERTLNQMSEMNLPDQFKTEMQAVNAWFVKQNECERTTIIYALLRHCSQLQHRFFLMVLQHMARKDPIAALLSPRSSMNELETKNPELLGKFSENESQASKKLLEVLPSLKDEDINSDSPESSRLYNRHSYPERRKQPLDPNDPSANLTGNWTQQFIIELRHSAPPMPSRYTLIDNTIPSEPLKPSRPAPPVPGGQKGATLPVVVDQPQPQPQQQPAAQPQSQPARNSFPPPPSIGPKPTSIPPQNPTAILVPQNPTSIPAPQNPTSLAVKRTSGSKEEFSNQPGATQTKYSSKQLPPLPGQGTNNPSAVSTNSSQLSEPGVNDTYAARVQMLYTSSLNNPPQSQSQPPVNPTPAVTSPPPIFQKPPTANFSPPPVVKSPPPQSQNPEEITYVTGQEMDIAGWLKALRLHKYTPLFEQMSWEKLINLTDDELLAMGMQAMGARKKILKEFELLKAEGYPPRAN